jgi:hypothetical protein
VLEPFGLSRRRVEKLDREVHIGRVHHQADGMQPLKPGHHSPRIVANQLGINAVRVQNCLRHIGFDLIGERPDHFRFRHSIPESRPFNLYRVRLRRIPLHIRRGRCRIDDEDGWLARGLPDFVSPLNPI